MGEPVTVRDAFVVRGNSSPTRRRSDRGHFRLAVHSRSPGADSCWEQSGPV